MLFWMAAVVFAVLYLQRGDAEDGAVFACMFIAGMNVLTALMSFYGVGLDRNVAGGSILAGQAVLFMGFAIYFTHSTVVAFTAAGLYAVTTALWFVNAGKGSGVFGAAMLGTFITIVLFRGALATSAHQAADDERQRRLTHDSIQDRPPIDSPLRARRAAPEPTRDAAPLRPTSAEPRPPSGRMIGAPASGPEPARPRPSGRRIGPRRPTPGDDA